MLHILREMVQTEERRKIKNSEKIKVYNDTSRKTNGFRT
jgi:hypothetical protein